MGSLLATRRVLANNVPIAFTLLEVVTEPREAMFLFYVLVSLFPFRLAGSMGRDGRIRTWL